MHRNGRGWFAVNSCLYEGSLAHDRREPRPHAFRYRLFMMYLDLAELDHLFDRFWLWSAHRPAIAWMRRADYLGDPRVPLDEAVRERVREATGQRPSGPIRLLTHLRYFGHCFNPVSFYYVFDAAGLEVETIVAEITNTPWKERHSYVLPVQPGMPLQWEFEKVFHVSPFMPMRQHYRWRLGEPAEHLYVHMENRVAGACVFSATMALRRSPLTRPGLARVLMRWPLMTLSVVTAIYWQALRLRLKGVPFIAHPAAAGGGDEA